MAKPTRSWSSSAGHVGHLCLIWALPWLQGWKSVSCPGSWTRIHKLISPFGVQGHKNWRAEQGGEDRTQCFCPKGSVWKVRSGERELGNEHVSRGVNSGQTDSPGKEYSRNQLLHSNDLWRKWGLILGNHTEIQQMGMQARILGIRLPWFKPWLCHVLAAWTWAR